MLPYKVKRCLAKSIYKLTCYFCWGRCWKKAPIPPIPPRPELPKSPYVKKLLKYPECFTIYPLITRVDTNPFGLPEPTEKDNSSNSISDDTESYHDSIPTLAIIDRETGPEFHFYEENGNEMPREEYTETYSSRSNSHLSGSINEDPQDISEPEDLTSLSSEESGDEMIIGNTHCVSRGQQTEEFKKKSRSTHTQIVTVDMYKHTTPYKSLPMALLPHSEFLRPHDSTMREIINRAFKMEIRKTNVCQRGPPSRFQSSTCPFLEEQNLTTKVKQPRKHTQFSKASPEVNRAMEDQIRNRMSQLGARTIYKTSRQEQNPRRKSHANGRTDKQN